VSSNWVGISPTSIKSSNVGEAIERQGSRAPNARTGTTYLEAPFPCFCFEGAEVLRAAIASMIYSMALGSGPILEDA
jgi:hypothetical protein